MKKNKSASIRSLFLKNIGQPPGALSEPEYQSVHTAIEIFQYDNGAMERRSISGVDLAGLRIDNSKVLWINIVGNSDPEVLRILEKRFDLSSLTLERIQNSGQRPGLYDFGHYMHTILKMITWDASSASVVHEQLSIILGKGFVISIQEKEGDVFDPVRERIEKGLGRVRGKGADYLSYVLIDSVVDNLFILCDSLQEHEEGLEETHSREKVSETFEKINHLKRQLIILRRAVWPLREMLTTIQKGEISLISEANLKYYRDVLDHNLIIIDMIEHLREVLNGLHESKVTNISVEMNNVMKVLTIIATIFIPLTFIAGIYGMNFSYMPELSWRWGYFAIMGLMALLFIVMLWFFKKKKWL